MDLDRAHLRLIRRPHRKLNRDPAYSRLPPDHLLFAVLKLYCCQLVCFFRLQYCLAHQIGWMFRTTENKN
jgi:hypothetical protein